MTIFEVEMSPLCQQLESNGQAVQVDIYRGEHGGWILEVLDEFGNSTVWDDEFPSDHAALGASQEDDRGRGHRVLDWHGLTGSGIIGLDGSATGSLNEPDSIQGEGLSIFLLLKGKSHESTFM